MSVQITPLDNGLIVATDTMPGVETVALGVWVGVGSRHETETENGLSHMLEHMAFKGTKTRSALDIVSQIEAVGGHMNAYTSREQTCFYVRLLKDDVPLGLDILSDILINPVFENAELAREQHVVLQEIGQAEDTPDDIVFDHLQEAAYPGQAFGRSILGTPQTVKAFRPDHLHDYMARHYRAPGMLVIGTGAIDHDALVKRAGEAFAPLSSARPERRDEASFETGFRATPRALEQLHVTLAFDGVSYSDPDFYAAQVLATALGGGMSSRLFQEVRERRGLAYSIYAFSSSWADTGLFGLYAGTSEEDGAELVSVIAGECQAIAAKASEEEVARARAQLKSSLLMAQESPTQRAEQLARQIMVFGREEAVSDQIAQLEAVDAAAMVRCAERLLLQGPPAYAAIGPKSALETPASLAARFAR